MDLVVWGAQETTVGFYKCLEVGRWLFWLAVTWAVSSPQYSVVSPQRRLFLLFEMEVKGIVSFLR